MHDYITTIIKRLHIADYDYNVVSTTSLAEAGIHVSLSNFASSPAVAANIQAVRIAPNTAASVALDVTNVRTRWDGLLRMEEDLEGE